MKILLFCLMVLTSSAFAQGKAIPVYGNAQNEAQQKTLDALKKWQMAEKYADIINGMVRLKSTIGMVVMPCGKPTAYFSSSKKAIYICTEFVDFVRNELAKSAMTKKEQSDALSRIMSGVLFHELAHAVIHTNGIPITGREEDVADQFSAMLMIGIEKHRNLEVIAPYVLFWKRLGESVDSLDVKSLSDEHSLSGQRAVNIACWALGANAKSGDESANQVGLPEKRRVRCAKEFAQLDNGIRRTFGKTIKF